MTDHVHNAGKVFLFTHHQRVFFQTVPKTIFPDCQSALQPVSQRNDISTPTLHLSEVCSRAENISEFDKCSAAISSEFNMKSGSSKTPVSKNQHLLNDLMRDLILARKKVKFWVAIKNETTIAHFCRCKEGLFPFFNFNGNLCFCKDIDRQIYELDTRYDKYEKILVNKTNMMSNTFLCLKELTKYGRLTKINRTLYPLFGTSSGEILKLRSNISENIVNLNLKIKYR